MCIKNALNLGLSEQLEFGIRYSRVWIRMFAKIIFSISISFSRDLFTFSKPNFSHFKVFKYNSKRCQQNNSWSFKSLLVMNSWRIRTDFVWMKLTFGFLNLCCNAKKTFEYGNEPTNYFSSQRFLCLQCIFTLIRLPLIGCISVAILNIQIPLLVDHII